MTTPSNQLASRGAQIIETLMKHWKLIAIPVLLCTLAAGLYAFKPKSYLASQSLVVRDDMVGESYKPGQFASLDTMKTAQETILHIAREPSVIRKALETIGPPHGKGHGWLEGNSGLDEIESAQEAISIVAPNGAEFGKTEVILLQVKASSRNRAGLLVTALLDEIETNLRSVRTRRLASMESELAQALSLAEEDYKSFANELEKLELEIGPDLPTLLNMINDVNAGNDFQVALENIRTASRTAQAQLDVTNKQLEMLRATALNPEELVATSNELLEAQPALSRLKDGLIDLQLKLSDDLGKFEEAHPEISKARFAISETKRQIHEELQIAIRGLESQAEVGTQQINRLQKEQKDFESRLATLTRNRVRYATLASQAKKRNEEHAKTRAEYAEIKALGQAAQKVNLMTRIDEPFVSSKALGPGRTSIVGSGLLGGVLIGLGLVMFFSAPGSLPIIEPPPSGPGENMVRPNDGPRSPQPTSNRPETPGSNPRPAASRPVQVVKQLDSTPMASPAAPSPSANQPQTPVAKATAEPRPSKQPPVAKPQGAPSPAGSSSPAQAKGELQFKAPSLQVASANTSNPTSGAQTTSKTSTQSQPKPSAKSSASSPTSEPPVGYQEVSAPPTAGSGRFTPRTMKLGPGTNALGANPSPQAAAQSNEPQVSSATKKKTTKIAPPRVKQETASEPTPTIMLPELQDQPNDKPPLIDLSKKQSSSSATRPSTNNQTVGLDDVKKQLMDAALKSLNSRQAELESANEQSLESRIQGLVDPDKK